ncbi:hypothetical protein [Euzebya sp.]|uniref:hypothetical protein n=1 Tax=Euzebya sp. TaxID=1971409 RepID=UPI0035168BBD
MVERWTTVGTYANRAMAEVGASVLRGADIRCRVVSEDAAGIATGLGAPGAEVQVPSSEAADAWVLLGGDDVPEPDGEDPAGGPESSTLAWAAVLTAGGLLAVLFVWELIAYLR